MLSQLIWWSSIALEALLLIRGLQTRLVFRFPYFYSYVTFVLLSDLLALPIRVTNPGYKYTFWSTELGGILFGCCLVLEIYRIGLARWRIEAGDEIPTEQNGQRRSSEEIMLDVNRAFEAAIRRDPANWFWVHKRWKAKQSNARSPKSNVEEQIAAG